MRSILLYRAVRWICFPKGRINQVLCNDLYPTLILMLHRSVMRVRAGLVRSYVTYGFPTINELARLALII